MNVPVDDAQFAACDIAPVADADAARQGGNNWFAVVALTVVYSFAFVDRQIFNMLVTPIKAQFGVSDLEMGYLLGPAFILSYVALGLPAGWCVDRFNRRNLLFGAGLLWGMGTMAGGLAHSYEGLFVSRLIVGASEALVFPAGLSFIADLVERRRLPLATSAFVLAPAIGGGFALLCGGLVLDWAERHGPFALPAIGETSAWQATLLLIGAIGMVPVLLLAFVPDRFRRLPVARQDREVEYGLIDGTRYILRRGRFYLAFFFGIAMSSMVMLTISAWAPTYLSRDFGMTPGEIGRTYGTLVLIFGIAGGIASPMLNAIVARRRPLDSTMRVVLYGPMVLVPVAVTLMFVHQRGLALGCLALLTFAFNFPLSMAGASLQVATPPRLRGVASAWYFIVGSLIGYGVGPTVVPIIADKVLGNPDEIGFAMAAAASLFGICAFALLRLALAGYQEERAASATPASSS